MKLIIGLKLTRNSLALGARDNHAHWMVIAKSGPAKTGPAVPLASLNYTFVLVLLWCIYDVHVLIIIILSVFRVHVNVCLCNSSKGVLHI